MTSAKSPPTAAAWSRFLSQVFLALGALLCMSGTVYFFAFNWQALGRFAKFGLIELGMVACFLLSLRVKGTASQWALTAASLLVGPLLGVYGQVYQTGGDPWQLFAAWVVLVLPWAMAGGFAPLWFGWLSLANTALWLFLEQSGMGRGSTGFQSEATLVALFNAAAWGLCEVQRPRVAWLRRSNFALFPALLTLGNQTMEACVTLVGLNSEFSWLLLLAAWALCLKVYSRRRQGLPFLAAACASLLFVVTTGAVRFLFDSRGDWLGSVLLLTIFVIFELGATASFLRWAQRSLASLPAEPGSEEGEGGVGDSEHLGTASRAGEPETRTGADDESAGPGTGSGADPDSAGPGTGSGVAPDSAGPGAGSGVAPDSAGPETVQGHGSSGLPEHESLGHSPAPGQPHVPVSPEEDSTPWYVRFVLGCGATVAGSLMLFVLALFGLLGNNAGTSMVVGVIIGLLGCYLQRASRGSAFAQQFALICLLAAQIIILIFLGDLYSHSYTSLGYALSGCCFQALWLWLYRERTGQFCTGLGIGALVSLPFADRTSALPLDLLVLGLALAAGWLWLAGLAEAVGSATVVSLFMVLLGSYWEFFKPQAVTPLSSAFLTLATAWLAARVIRRLQLPMGPGLAVLGGILVAGLITWKLPGVVAGLAVLVLGFEAGSPLLQGMAWAFLLNFGTTYYYELSLDLWAKSLALLGSGTFFLLVRLPLKGGRDA